MGGARRRGGRGRGRPGPGGRGGGGGPPPDWVKRVAPFDLPLTLESMLFATCWPTADATATEREFGIRFRDLDESLTDTYRWLARAGHVSIDRIGKLAN